MMWAPGALHIIWGRRFSVRFAERVERNRPTGRIGKVIAVLQVGPAGVESEVAGDGRGSLRHPRHQTRRLRWAVDHRSFALPALATCSGGLRRTARESHFSRGGQTPAQVRDRPG